MKWHRIIAPILVAAAVTGCAPSYQYLDWRYDQAQNQTLAQVKTDAVVAGGVDIAQRGWTLKMGAFFVTPGDRVKRPEQVVLKLSSQAGNEQYPSNRYLELMVSGERVTVGNLNREVANHNGYVVETMTAAVPFETFLKIATATSVTGKLYATSFQLRENDLEAFKQFAVEVAGLR